MCLMIQGKNNVLELAIQDYSSIWISPVSDDKPTYSDNGLILSIASSKKQEYSRHDMCLIFHRKNNVLELFMYLHCVTVVSGLGQK